MPQVISYQKSTESVSDGRSKVRLIAGCQLFCKVFHLFTDLLQRAPGPAPILALGEESHYSLFASVMTINVKNGL